MEGPAKGQPDVAAVKGPDGSLCGLWLRDPQAAQDRDLLGFLLIRFQAGREVGIAAEMGDYRVVPNTFDSGGGCFVMFKGALAPGEKPQGTPASEGAAPGEAKPRKPGCAPALLLGLALCALALILAAAAF